MRFETRLKESEEWGVKPQLDKATQTAAGLALAVSQYDERRESPMSSSSAAASRLLRQMLECSVMINQLKLILDITDESWDDMYSLEVDEIKRQGYL